MNKDEVYGGLIREDQPMLNHDRPYTGTDTFEQIEQQLAQTGPNDVPQDDTAREHLAVRLFNKAMLDACRYLTGMLTYDGSQHGFGTGLDAYHLDDDQDYSNACCDVITYTLSVLQGNDGEGVLAEFDRLVHLTAEELQAEDHAAGLMPGYADFRTPLMDLMAANHEED